MKTLVFFLEEPSAAEMLKGLLPRILPDHIHTQYIVFQGKQALEKHLAGKLRGWLAPDSYFVVLRDQDRGDCKAIKQDILSLCKESGRPGVLVRIACRELESFYLGDLAAVEQGLGVKGVGALQRKQKYRNPDVLIDPHAELCAVTSDTYQKLLGSRAIAPFLDIAANRSASFRALVSGIQKLVASD